MTSCIPRHGSSSESGRLHQGLLKWQVKVKVHANPTTWMGSLEHTLLVEMTEGGGCKSLSQRPLTTVLLRSNDDGVYAPCLRSRGKQAPHPALTNGDDHGCDDATEPNAVPFPQAIKPQPGDLAHGSYTLPTTLGPIIVSFQQYFGDTQSIKHSSSGSGGSAAFEMQVSLPSGCTGEVAVPLAQLVQSWPEWSHVEPRGGAVRVLHNGKAVATVPSDAGVPSVVIKDVHPGRHTFAATVSFAN